LFNGLETTNHYTLQRLSWVDANLALEMMGRQNWAAWTYTSHGLVVTFIEI